MGPTGAPSAIAQAPVTAEPLAATCTIEQFNAVDLRVARVLSAEPVQASEKLMRLELDLGALGRRTVLAGIKKAYSAEQLVGRQVIVCANLAPRKMKFGVSDGMILAAGAGGTDLALLSVESNATPGQRV
ncbi:MAG: methionine--tRNA ligase subunit beta, partial [Planctomycetes bacterium]|nr:methionine--tRNA ligase subunit beta [Planctomycetota bacterium]